MNLFLQEEHDETPYSRVYIRDMLKKKYGDAVCFTNLPGAAIVMNFKGVADAILYEKWYSERKASLAEERLRVVQAAAQIILQDIRATVYDTDVYPTPDALKMAEGGPLPETLKYFLENVITTKAKRNHENAVKRKRCAIGEAVIAACRPRSFISPILLGVGIFAHLSGSREMIDLLSSMSFSASYKEVQRLVMQNPPTKIYFI